MNIKLRKLTLPQYQFEFKEEAGKVKIYDFIRKKYIILTPEEWVRQNFLRYMVEEKGYPKSRIKLEHTIKINNLSKRCDAVFFDKSLKPQMLIEFKEPNVSLSRTTLIQSGIYNSLLKAELLILSNGLEHLFIKPDYESDKFELIDEIPIYNKKL